MAEEHHIANLDPSAFFTLHDFDNDGSWTGEEIRRTYGLDDESAKDIDESKKADVVRTVKELFDKDGDGVISREEWMDRWVKDGKRLPDFGVGIGSYCTRLDMRGYGDRAGAEGFPWSEYLLLQGGWRAVMDTIVYATLLAELFFEDIK